MKNGKTKLVDDVPGEELDLKQTVANVNALLGEKRGKTPGETKVVFREKQADIQTEDLADLTDVLGSYTTYYGATGDGRSINVESGARHIGGTLIPTGRGGFRESFNVTLHRRKRICDGGFLCGQ